MLLGYNSGERRERVRCSATVAKEGVGAGVVLAEKQGVVRARQAARPRHRGVVEKGEWVVRRVGGLPLALHLPMFHRFGLSIYRLGSEKAWR